MLTNKQKSAKKYREENKEKIKEYNKKYYEKTKEKFKIDRKEYKKKYNAKKRKNNSVFKLKENIRNLIRSSIKRGGYKKNTKTNEILGCTFEEFVIFLNDNEYGFIYGEEDLDIDHIIALSNAKTKEELIKLNHYSNFQLLPSEYNRYVKRNNKWDKNEFELWYLKEKF